MTARAIFAALVLGAALGALGCKRAPAQVADAGPGQTADTGVDGGPAPDSGHCFVGRSAVGDCAL